MHGGNVGIAFVTVGGDKQRDYAVRRLQRVAAEMRGRGQHGLWLLWAERGSPEHNRLREQLGLPRHLLFSPASFLLGEARALGWMRAEPGAAEAEAGVDEEEFVIVRMRSGRIAATYVMPAPFSYAAIGEFAASFARDELRPEGWQAQLARWAPLWLPLVAALCLLRAARRKAPTGQKAPTPVAGQTAGGPSIARPSGPGEQKAATAHAKKE